MAIDRYEDLPGIISELQDGGLQIFEENGSPAVLILGTAEKGLSDTPVQATRAQEEENRFGKSGTLIRGMYETLQGGAGNVNLMRIAARSAILFGIGTDNMVANPTSIETLLKDADAGSVYFVRYVTPTTRGPNEVIGHLKIKNAVGQLVFDSNPGGQLIDSGEVLVSGELLGGVDIGASGDPEDYIAMNAIAQDETAIDDTFAASLITPVLYSLGGLPDAAVVVTVDIAGTPVVLVDTVDYNLVGQDVTLSAAAALSADHLTIDFDYDVAATPTNEQFGPSVSIANFTLSQTPNQGTLNVSVDGVEVAEADYGLVGTTVTFINIEDTDNVEVIASYEYDADAAHNLREGHDGVNLSNMELYEALEDAYRRLESEEFKMVIPMGTRVDAKNSADGDIVVLSTDDEIAAGRNYPVQGMAGDALGKLFVEEYDGEFFYFWDTNDDGVAELYPNVGSASSTTKIDGSALAVEDFVEVNFPYQLAAFCFKASTNEFNVLGSIGTSLPASFSPKDISKWIGKEAEYDIDKNIIIDGTGLLGNKLMVGTTANKPGFYATDEEEYQGSGGPTGVLEDRGGRAIDIGRYLSVYSAPMTFFNAVDETGFGYHSNGAAYYGGYITTLVSQSSPSNKIAPGAVSPVKLSKAKLNSLAKFSYVSLKQKNRVLRFSDAPTAARKESDFRRLTTMRVIDEIIDDVRRIATPYIGEPNTQSARKSLETNIIKLLGEKQEGGVIQRFEVKVSASVKQRIEGDMTVELVIVPPFEVRKIEVITSLAKE